MTGRLPFSQEKGLEFQSSDLTRWFGILTDDARQQLMKVVAAHNQTLKSTDDGYSVVRGNEITQIVADIANGVSFSGILGRITYNRNINR